jgi:ribonucleoside-diphosphate reductase alpha chain
LIREESIEGAPDLKAEHLAVFDSCYPGRGGRRRISWQDQLNVVAAAQKFISGAISKTVNLPAETGRDEISRLYLEARRLGLKSVALYREGSKSSQPLSQRA